MPHAGKPAYDFALTIDSVLYPFWLARQEGGVLPWNDGLAPMLAPQVRTEGFGVEHIPPDIEVIEPVDNVSVGAGFDLTVPGNVGYNYSRGIDLSWEDRATVSLKQQTSSGAGSALAIALAALSPAGYWRLGEDSGNALDSSGNANHGTVTIGVGGRDATALDAGGDGSIDFDGANTRVVITDTAVLQNVFDGGGGVNVHFIADGNGEGGAGLIVAKSNFTNGWMVRINGGSLEFLQWFSGAFGEWATTDPLIHGYAYHLHVDYNNDSVANNPTFYLTNKTTGVSSVLTVGSGLTEPQAPVGTRVTDVGQDMTIGNDTTAAASWDGRIDEVAVFSTPPSQSQIEVVMAATLLDSFGGAPVKFYQSSLGFFMLAGAYIYEYDLTTNTWVLRDDASAQSASYKDIVELDGVLYATRGSTVTYKYSLDGITWTLFTGSDFRAEYIAARGNGSDVAALWSNASHVIQTTTDGRNGGVAWAGSDEMGHSSETARSMIVVDNTIYLFKQEGIYSYDGVNSQDVWKTQSVNATNGKNAFLWSNGKIYVPYGRKLLEYDPYGDTALEYVYPTKPTIDSLELRGDVTAIGGDDNNLYIAIKNRAGNTYIMKGYNSGGFWVWHSILYLGANDCNVLAIVTPGIMHATNPVLVYGYDTSTRKVVLPQDGIHPSDDPMCVFDTTEGVLYGSYLNFGAKTFNKFLNRGMMLGTNLSAGRYATLKYETDRSGSESTLVEAVSAGITDTDVSGEVEFALVRPVLYMATGDESSSPVVDAFALAATLNPRRKRMWQPVVLLDDQQLMKFGGSNNDYLPSVHDLRQALYGATTKRITMTDHDQHSYTVRLLDIRPAALVDKVQGGNERDLYAYQLVIVEVNTLSTDQTVAIYDESTYDSGHVYG